MIRSSPCLLFLFALIAAASPSIAQPPTPSAGAGVIEGCVTDAGTGNPLPDKWLADPDAPGANQELALFGTAGYEQDREGLGIYALPDGKGYIVSVDQLPGESVFHVYRREGEPGRPHDHSRVLLSFKGGADGTDGLDVTSSSLGPDFPDGMMIAMNSASKNFLMFRWRDIAYAAAPPLQSASRLPATR